MPLLFVWLGLAGCEREQPAVEIPADTGLDDSVLESIGDVLLVNTAYGYGWAKAGESDPEPLPDFHIQIDSFWHLDGTRRGGVAKVVEPDHPADGMWVVFSTRHVASYNFSDKVGFYNLDIGDGELEPTESGWPLLTSGAVYQGWGEIRYDD